MKKLQKTSILQKTIITMLIALLLSNFVIPTYSQAGIGGVLMDPIVDLICTIGDAIINVLQKCMMKDWGSSFSLNGGFLVDSETFFEEDEYANLRTTETGETIDPNDSENRI